MNEKKIRRLLAALCWCGTALSGFLMGYMLHLVRNYPEVESFARNTRIAGVLMLVWLATAVFFTVRALCGRKDGTK